ncbi:radical SAM protein [Helicobacter sp.]|uniref:radical SAM/SPASM domain-containing protein n=1 Tax=Helicobacter sp. TaxID=218 RepID=UPI002A76268A|nr:radical SAM protein [Helicobacter sp.]MDY2585001.1 radical SAM protein [Helicobacter sp.]
METTNNCTARCTMCGINEWRKKMESDYMEDDLFYKIADEIIANKDKVMKVALFVGNEPLLDKNLSKRIQYLKSKEIKVNFSTNGSLMDYDKAVEILESGVDHINFSIDGLDKQVYEQIRKPLKFEDVLGNVLQFIKLRDGLKKKTQIRISIIKTKQVDDDLERVCGFWNKMLNASLGDGIRIDDLSVVYGTQKNLQKINGMELDEKLPYHHTNEVPCYILWNTLVVKCDGSVALCNVDQCRKIKLGNLNNHSIKEIWNHNADKLAIMRKHLDSGRGSVDVCKNCIGWL